MDTLNVPDALDSLGTLGLLSTPSSSSHPIHASDLTIITAEVDLLAPTLVAQPVEEADPNHNTAADSSTAAAREHLTAPVLAAPLEAFSPLLSWEALLLSHSGLEPGCTVPTCTRTMSHTASTTNPATVMRL
jgi:hypothetical protein